MKNKHIYIGSMRFSSADIQVCFTACVISRTVPSGGRGINHVMLNMRWKGIRCHYERNHCLL